MDAINLVLNTLIASVLISGAIGLANDLTPAGSTAPTASPAFVKKLNRAPPAATTADACKPAATCPALAEPAAKFVESKVVTTLSPAAPAPRPTPAETKHGADQPGAEHANRDGARKFRPQDRDDRRDKSDKKATDSELHKLGRHLRDVEDKDWDTEKQGPDADEEKATHPMIRPASTTTRTAAAEPTRFSATPRVLAFARGYPSPVKGAGLRILCLVLPRFESWPSH